MGVMADVNVCSEDNLEYIAICVNAHPNAVVHRDYSTGSPIQIKVFDDRIYIFNDKRLSANITDNDLFSAHKSSP
jgi:ATP-dependent DNA helicase RecG